MDCPEEIITMKGLLLWTVREAASILDRDHQLEMRDLALGMEEEVIIKPALEDL